MSENYDVIVIGAGPAGYAAAIRCRGLKKTAKDSGTMSSEDRFKTSSVSLFHQHRNQSKALLHAYHK